VEIGITLRGGSEAAEGTKTELLVAWQTLSTAHHSAPSTGGVYWLGAPLNLIYGQTVSRIFYIGSSINLRRRLAGHARLGRRGNPLLRVLAEGDPSRILCAFHGLPHLKEVRLRGFEYGLAKIFAVAHGRLIPYGNQMPPDNESDEDWGDQLRVTEPEIPGEALAPEMVAARFGLSLGEPCHAYSSLVIDPRAGTATDESIYSIDFRFEKRRRGRVAPA